MIAGIMKSGIMKLSNPNIIAVIVNILIAISYYVSLSLYTHVLLL